MDIPVPLPPRPETNTLHADRDEAVEGRLVDLIACCYPFLRPSYRAARSSNVAIHDTDRACSRPIRGIPGIAGRSMIRRAPCNALKAILFSVIRF